MRMHKKQQQLNSDRSSYGVGGLARLCVQGEEGELSRGVGFSHCLSCSQQVVSSDIIFVTLFPTTVETVRDTSVLAILTFHHFGGHVSLCDW